MGRQVFRRVSRRVRGDYEVMLRILCMGGWVKKDVKRSEE